MSDRKEHISKLLFTGFVTHDVKRFIVERPQNYSFAPGQATNLSINLSGWEDKKRPFSFTSLHRDPVLEFTIKGYSDHDGVTKQLHTLEPGAKLFLEDAWGAIQYRGPGTFLAGGAGITPFIAILRQLKLKGKAVGNRLFFSNATAADVILEKELSSILPQEDLILTLTEEDKPGYAQGRIDAEFLKKQVKDFQGLFYVCGPPAFVKDVKGLLADHGADPESFVFEK